MVHINKKIKYTKSLPELKQKIKNGMETFVSADYVKFLLKI